MRRVQVLDVFAFKTKCLSESLLLSHFLRLCIGQVSPRVLKHGACVSVPTFDAFCPLRSKSASIGFVLGEGVAPPILYLRVRVRRLANPDYAEKRDAFANESQFLYTDSLYGHFFHTNIPLTHIKYIT